VKQNSLKKSSRNLQRSDLLYCALICSVLKAISFEGSLYRLGLRKKTLKRHAQIPILVWKGSRKTEQAYKPDVLNFTFLNRSQELSN